jgi:hypothetical protein
MNFRLNAGAYAATDIFKFMEGATNHTVIGIDGSGHIVAKRNTTLLTGGTSSNVLSLNTWYSLEILTKVHDTTGTVEVRVNGSNSGWLNLSSLDTRNGATGVINQLQISPTNAFNALCFADFIIWDTTGSAPNNTFLGSKRVTLVAADGDGTTSSWTPNSGANNFSRVNEASVDDDTSYISSNAAGTVQLFTFADNAFGTVNAVITNIYNRKDDANAYTLAEQCRSGGTTYTGAKTLTPGATYFCEQEIRELDPATSAAWTASGVNAAEFGVKQVT